MSQSSRVRRRKARGGELGRLFRALLGDERGQELVEMVIVLPLLLLTVLGIAEIGHVFTINHGMAALSRESANLAARGTSLAQAAQIAVTTGDDILLSTNGGAIATRLRVQGGTPVVIAQAAFGSVGASKMGTIGDSAAPLTGVAFADGRVLYTVEIFYQYQPLTPLLGVAGAAIVPNQLYEAAVF